MQTKREQEERGVGGAHMLLANGNRSPLCAQPGRQLTVLILAYFFLQHIGTDMRRKPQTQAHPHTHTWQIFTLALTFALALTLAARPRLRFIFGLGICFL